MKRDTVLQARDPSFVMREAVESLKCAGIEAPDLVAKMLLQHFTGLGATALFFGNEHPLRDQQHRAFQAALARCLAGEPVHRVIGKRDFYTVTLSLSAETLEPRPDTECLVDAVLDYIRKAGREEEALALLDLGTGSGAIAIALLDQLPHARCLATDISDNALATATANASANGVANRFSGLKSDWMGEVSGRFDIIVSNPPYIASKTVDALSPSVRDHDPRRALDGGPDGLAAYRTIFAQAVGAFNPGGCLAVEIGYDQKRAVVDLARKSGWHLGGDHQDLAGHDRALVFEPGR